MGGQPQDRARPLPAQLKAIAVNDDGMLDGEYAGAEFHDPALRRQGGNGGRDALVVTCRPRTVERRLTGGAALAATASAAANPPPKLNALRMEMTLNKWR